jgi:hypothetical protein
MRLSAVGSSLRPAGSAADLVGRVGLAGLDALLGWRYTDEAVKRILASPVADHAVDHALAANLPEHAVERLLADGIVDRLADRMLEGPELEGVATRAIDSRLLDTVVERLLESEELWRLVDEVAGSPAVLDAVGQQGAGLVDQVAGQVRVRSQRADAGMERVARRLLRRGPAAPGVNDGGA